jgi:hypothetical protein
MFVDEIDGVAEVFTQFVTQAAARSDRASCFGSIAHEHIDIAIGSEVRAHG